MSLTGRPVRIAVLLLWMLLLTLWSGQSDLPIDQPQIRSLLFNMQHRLAHLVSFGLLGLLACWAFEGVPRARLLAVLLASAFGATDEWHQSWTPGRAPRVDDWLFDTVSAALAVFLWPYLAKWRLSQLAPVAVALVFAVAIGFLIKPHASDVLLSMRTFAREIRSATS